MSRGRKNVLPASRRQSPPGGRSANEWTFPPLGNSTTAGETPAALCAA